MPPKTVVFLLASLLTGCPAVGPQQYDRVRDVDEDGSIATRFGGPDCLDDDPSVLDCDLDGDGVRSLVAGGPDCDDSRADVNPSAVEVCDGVDNDCNGLTDANDPDTLDTVPGFEDLDGDGAGGSQFVPVCADVPPAGRVLVGGDCDDDQASVHPGAVEFCDLVDRDCDGDTFDPDATDAVAARVVDADSDGFTTGVMFGPGCVTTGLLDAVFAPPDLDCDDTDSATFPGAVEVFYDGVDQGCDGPANDDDADGDGVPSIDDCDDTDPLVAPGAVERCDGVDNDCDGAVDSDDPDVLDPSYVYLRDADGDGFGDGDLVRGFCPGDDTSGWTLALGVTDCDDTVAATHPFADERCDGLDNDCNGTVDDGATDAGVFYVDLDGDGFGATEVAACTTGDHVAALGGDCDDTTATTFPGAPETCGDGVLQDCLRPELRSDCDLDGALDVLVGGTDCDDANPAVLAGADEVCDGFDNDCDGDIDGGAVDATVYFVDEDGDGFGHGVRASCTAEVGLVSVDGDCDDTASGTFPGAFEVCGDGVLQDCESPSRANDCDGDGEDDEAFGGTDCDDTDATVFAAAHEVCDGADNDCDSLVDDLDPSVDLSTATDWFQDLDGDGFGSGILLATNTCAGPAHGVVDHSDCDDLDATRAPDLPEICDGEDNDCNGLPDDGAPIDAPTFHLDLDGDGFGDPDRVFAGSCTLPHPPHSGGSWLLDDRDCDDQSTLVHPDATELCDGFDNDCDLAVDDADAGDGGSFAPLSWYLDHDGDGVGQAGAVTLQCVMPARHVGMAGDCDDGDVAVTVGQTWYADHDGDGFGDPHTGVEQCGAPANHVGSHNDCDDTDASVNPGALEVCDTVDNDCDGLADDADPGTVGTIVVFTDADGDGVGAVGTRSQVCVPPAHSAFVEGDCDDSDASVAALRPYWPDADGDGFALDTANPSLFCPTAVPTNFADQQGDCDDSAGFFGTGPFFHPDVPESCDGFDNDCDGLVDANDPSLVEAGTTLLYRDNDQDGYGDPDRQLRTCGPVVGYVDNTQDCDDSSGPFGASTYRWFGAPEFCDGLDNDCDGLLDEADPDSRDLTVLAADITDQFDQVFELSEALARVCDGATLTLGQGTHYIDGWDILPDDRFDQGMELVGTTDASGAPLARLVRWDDPSSRQEPMVWVETSQRVRLANLEVDCTTPSGAIAYTGPGAGLLAENGAQVELENVHFTNCSGSYGGTVAVSDSTLEMHEVSLTGSVSEGDGGGVWISESEAVLEDVRVTDAASTGGRGGAVAVLGNSEVWVDDLTVASARALSHGGGVFLGAGVRFEAEDLWVGDHTHTSEGDGGGLYAVGAEVFLEDSAFVRTLAHGASGRGGAIAAVASSLSSVGLQVDGASASDGGALHLRGTDWDDVGGDYRASMGLVGAVFDVEDGSLRSVDSAFMENTPPGTDDAWMRIVNAEAWIEGMEAVRNKGSLRVEEVDLRLDGSRLLDTEAVASLECFAESRCRVGTTVFAGRLGRTDTGLHVDSGDGMLVLDHNDWTGHGVQAVRIESCSALACTETDNLFHANTADDAIATSYLVSGRVTVDPEYAAFHPGFLHYEHATFLPTAGAAVHAGAMAAGERALWFSDLDADGLPDAFERRHCGSLVACEPDADPDADTLSHLVEAGAFTSPTSNDTDGDGVLDASDVDPLDPGVP